jgi:nucleoside-diphosphate-sugar epimerase
VGRALRNRLDGIPLTWSDRSQLDVEDLDALHLGLGGYEQIVHLASPLRRPGWTSGDMETAVRIAGQVLDAARSAGVRRVVLPSSILATSRAQLVGTTRVGIQDSQPPDTEYGRNRLLIEALGRAASGNGIEIVCIRLGTVRHPDAPVRRPELRTHWLSHEDCAALFRACLTAPFVPGRFSLFYAVSDLPGRVFDTSNPFDWAPGTDTVGLRRSAVAAAYRLNTGVRGWLQIRTRLRAIVARITG